MIPDADKIASQLAELRNDVVPNERAPVLPLTESGRVADIRIDGTELTWAYSDRSARELIQEAAIKILHRGLRWQRDEQRTLRLLAERVQDECRRLIAEKEQLEAANAELRRELNRVREEAARLRAGSEHARGFLEWGMGNAD